jgi:hypothetical protein
MILGYYSTSAPKLFYIGMVYNQHVTQRLSQPDHRQRYVRLRHDHPNHRFRVSLGAVEIENGRITRNRIDQIETILVFAHYEENQQQIINKRKWMTHRITSHYTIHNYGYRAPLYREIHLGIFAK